MKYSANLEKLTSFCLVAVLAVFNFLYHPALACASTNSTLSTVVLNRTLAPQNCCCPSGDCCAKRNTDCSSYPLDESLPVSLKLPVLRLAPVLALASLANFDDQPSWGGSKLLRLNQAYLSLKPAKLYLVHRTLLI